MVEWTRLPALILVVVAFLLWLSNRSGGRQLQIASTEIWQRLAPSRVRRPLPPLVIALLLSLAAAAPIIISPPPSIDLGFHRDGNGRLHLELLADPGSAGVAVVAAVAGTPLARGTLEAATDASAATLELPSANPGDLLTVTVGTISQSLEIPEPLRPRIYDLSNSPEIGNGLAALELAGRIERVRRGADIAIVRGEGEAPASLAIRLPASGSEASRFLIGPDPHLRPSHLVSGLGWQAWTVLEATAIGGGDRILIAGDDGQPLLVIEEGGARFAFDPAHSTIPLRAGWPVLLGRLIEELTVPPAPALEKGRSLLPSFLAAAAALLSLAVATGSRTILVLMLIAAATLAPIVVPSPPIPLTGRDTGSILDLARSLPPGSTIAIDSDRPVPGAASSADQLRQRGINISIIGSSLASIVTTPSRVLPGQPVTITSVGPGTLAPLEIWQEKVRVATLDATPSTWIPTRPGIAFIHSPVAGTTSAVIVDRPVASAVLAPDRDAGATLLPSPVFSQNPSDSGLPRPAKGSAVIFNGAPLSIDEAGHLESWLIDGGTLLAVAAPPYIESSEDRQRIDQLLPAPLPAPPAPPVEDHGVLLLDLSGSLSGSGARTLLAGTVALLEGTPAGGRWGILGFRDSTRWLVPPGTPIDNSAIEKIRTDIRTGGGTRLDVAIEEALRALEAAGRGRALVVVSDGRSEPADWARIGGELKTAGVRLDFVAVGESIDRSVVKGLSEAASGRWHHAADARQAVHLLGDAISPSKGNTQPVRGELRPASLDGLVAGSPRRLPGPPQRIAISRRHPDSRTLWVDETGSPLLLGRSIGAGTSLLWLAGLDDASLGSAAGLIRDALSTLLLDATRGKLAVGENARWSIDEQGRRGLLVDSEAGSPAVLDYRLTAVKGDSMSAISAALLPGRGRLIPVEAGEAIGWIAENPEGVKTAGALPARGQSREWQRWQLAKGLGEKRWPPPNPWLLALAVILVLLPLRGQQPRESGVGSGPANG